MKYINAAKILPENLLIEVQKYASGKILYIPLLRDKKQWGEVNGAKEYYKNRNITIKEQFKNGVAIDLLASRYGLTPETIKKIIYNQ